MPLENLHAQNTTLTTHELKASQQIKAIHNALGVRHWDPQKRNRRIKETEGSGVCSWALWRGEGGGSKHWVLKRISCRYKVVLGCLTEMEDAHCSLGGEGLDY